jgi:hypothetical protein
MGELVRSMTVDVSATRVKDFADDTSEFKNASQYTEEILAVGKSLKMPGGANSVYSWEARHPNSDRVTKGEVFVWSVSEALAANGLSDRMNAAGGWQGGAGISTQRSPTNPRQPEAARPSGKPSSGAGAEGETP